MERPADVLSARAELFNRIVLEDTVDDHGLVRHQLTHPHRKPLTADLLHHVKENAVRRQQLGQRWHPLAGTPAHAMYEDANYCANRYLITQVWRWLAGGAPDARRAAGLAYRATLYPYEQGRRIEPGYWPKPYGGLRGEYAIGRSYTETSLDQAYSPAIALWRYAQHLAGEAERRAIGSALREQAHWWIRHRYRHDFLGGPQAAIGNRVGPSQLKIPAGQHFAYRLTGDTALRDECLRLVRKGVAEGTLRMHRGPRGEIKDLYHWAEIYAYFLSETELAAEADWPRLIQECWRAGKSTIQPDGLCLRMGYFDPETGLVERYEPGPIDDIGHGYWKTDARDPASTVMIACLAMLIHELGYDPEAGAVGTQLLHNVTERHLAGAPFQPYWVHYERPEQMAPEFRDRPLPLFFSTRIPVFWLDAYWRAVRLGIIPT